MFRRNIEQRLTDALQDTPVVVLTGARQTGKSTLAQKIAAELPRASYLTLDDAATLAAAAHDPSSFIRGIAGTAIIDEAQKCPALFPAIKLEVDRKRDPGRFLLTGSANVLMLPRLADSLAGRMEVIRLMPLSQGELNGMKEAFVSRLFSGKPFVPSATTAPPQAIRQALLRGGYPEALRRSDTRRNAWFGSYITAILQRDVRDLAHIEALTEMPKLLSLLAARTASLLNMSEVSRSAGIPYMSLKRYMALLEMTFMVRLLPPWSGNLSKRLVKSPKVLLSDTALTAYLIGIDGERLARDPTLMGPLLESFVALELLKQQTWAEIETALYHFRTSDGLEADLALEDRQGRIAVIDVKATAGLRREDFAGLQKVVDTLGNRVVAGVLLYQGDQTITFGPRLQALPVARLWKD